MDRSLPDPLIELIDMRAAYGRIQVLHGVDLRVSPGTFTALLGPNGAGKSTTLKVLAGQVPATGGHVHIAGRHVNGADPDALARVGVCLIPEGRGVFPNLTVADNLKVFSVVGTPLREVEEHAYTRFPRLGERRNQIAGTMSGGEQQMLALARGLVEELYEVVAQIASEGVTVLAVEQFARLVLGVADTAAIMGGGRVTFVGDPHQAERLLEEAYLGA
jgi:branched-chain amino acid transport system ATP-binding protein